MRAPPPPPRTDERKAAAKEMRKEGKRPWSKPSLRIFDGALPVASGPTNEVNEFAFYNPSLLSP